MILAVLILAAVGHVIFWVALVNRVHALGIQRIWVKLATIGCGVALAAIPLAIALDFYRDPISRADDWLGRGVVLYRRLRGRVRL